MTPLSETMPHMTKKILMDTGTIPDTPPAGLTKDGAFAYAKPDWASTIVGGVAWEGCRYGTDTGVRCESLYGGGVGRIPSRKGCGDFPEIQNCRDDGTSLWSDWRCNTWCDGNWNWNDGGFCHTQCGGQGAIVKPLWDLQYCPNNGDMIAGLCYDKCNEAEGYRREGLLCTRSYTKRSEVLAPHTLECDSSKFMNAGLCYRKDLPEGYTRKTWGLLDQTCPDDNPAWSVFENFKPTLDIGVSCQKATYTRKPYPKFSIYGKIKKDPPVETPDPPMPPICSSLPARADDFVMTEQNRQICRKTECSADSELSADGLLCVKKCNAGFIYNFANKACEKIKDDGTKDSYNNSEGVFEVEYDFH
jgi:hypothetical protein